MENAEDRNLLAILGLLMGDVYEKYRRVANNFAENAKNLRKRSEKSPLVNAFKEAAKRAD